MRNEIWYLAFGGTLIVVLISFYFFTKTSKTLVLGENVVVTSSPTPAESPTPSPTESPTPEPTETPPPSPLASPKPKAEAGLLTPSPVPPAEINAFIDRFAAQYSVDPNVLRHIAICESGFNPNALNGPYVGLFQFGKITWKNLRKEFGEDTNPDLRFSAEESAQTAAYALSKGKSALWPNCFP